MNLTYNTRGLQEDIVEVVIQNVEGDEKIDNFMTFLQQCSHEFHVKYFHFIALSSPKDMKQKRKSKQKQTFAFKNKQAPNA